jgi:hypothetical protein
MRSYFLILSILLISNGVSGSDTLLVNENKVWATLTQSYPPNGGGSQNTWYCKIRGDTIISDTTYLMVFENYDSTEATWYFSNKYIRQESDKVFLRNNYNKETLLYDFSLNIGDTIIQKNMRENEYEWKVESKDSIELLDGWHRSHYSGPTLKSIWGRNL